MPPRPLLYRATPVFAASNTNGRHTPEPRPLRGLKPFTFHGIDFVNSSPNESIGDCPFCSEDGKFYVNVTTGQWECKRCDESGNALTFIRRLHEESGKRTNRQELTELATTRRMLLVETLEKWGVVKSCISGEWMVPGYSADGKLCQLYCYKMNHQKEKEILYATPKVSDDDEVVHGLFGGHLFDKDKQDIHITEGCWDAMAEYELIGGKTNILGTPGAMIFYEAWAIAYCKGRRVSILFDNDYPKVNKQTGDEEEPRGYKVTKRVAGVLKGLAQANKPETVKYLKWGEDGYDPSKPDGYDVRDVLTLPQKGTEGVVARKERDRRLKELLQKMESCSDEWPAVKLGSEEVTPLKCESWVELIDAWKKALYWIPGLEKALAVMLSSAISTEMIGEQIWVRVMSPPSSGKTTLAEALAVSKKYVVSKSTITRFHSGYKTDADGAEDHSLIPQLKNKTFIIKDADTLLRAPNRKQIMAEARDIYDGTSRAYYGHGVNRDHEDLRITMIILGTSSLRELDGSESGARFIDCIVYEGVHAQQEDKINDFIIDQVLKNIGTKITDKAESKADPDKLRAKRLTGGYLEYLRENCERLIAPVQHSPDARARLQAIGNYGKLVAFLRARPGEQDEVVEREFSGRVTAQYARLAICLAAVKGKDRIDDEISTLVKGIAADTCRGKSLDIVQYLYDLGETGAEFAPIHTRIGGKEDELKAYLKFMKDIGCLESYELRKDQWTRGTTRYRVSQDVRRLYRIVMKGGK